LLFVSPFEQEFRTDECSLTTLGGDVNPLCDTFEKIVDLIAEDDL